MTATQNIERAAERDAAELTAVAVAGLYVVLLRAA
jgi:hypothetical protein